MLHFLCKDIKGRHFWTGQQLVAILRPLWVSAITMLNSVNVPRYFASSMLAGLILQLLALSPQASGIELPIKVVATTGMIADVVRQVGDNRVSVAVLMGPGIDPHLYKPTRSDVARLLSADVIFYNGLLLEGKMTDALVRVASSGRPVVAVTEKLPEDFLLAPQEFQGHSDPHVWMDPVAWSETISVIERKLSEIDSSGQPQYSARADNYRRELQALHEYAARVLETVPKSSRVLVSAHDAFNYFGRRYNYEVIGIQGLSTESEAGVQDIEKLVGILVSRSVKAVFVETTVSERNIRALIEGAKAQGKSVQIGGNLYSDAMGEAGTYEGTYIGMIDHNITTITRALGGQAPERGMRDQLSTVKR